MVESFKGKVKIEDIQKAFDNIVAKINNAIEVYNSASITAQDYDPKYGGSSLGQKGYCLTVGGLKQVLAKLEGAVIGAKVIGNTTNSTSCIITSGKLIHNTSIITLPNNPTTEKAQNTNNLLLYDATDDEYKFGSSGFIYKTWEDWEQPVANANDSEAGTVEFQCSSFSGLKNTNAYKALGDNAGYGGFYGGNYNATKKGSGGNVVVYYKWKFPVPLKVSSVNLRVSTMKESGFDKAQISLTTYDGSQELCDRITLNTPNRYKEGVYQSVTLTNNEPQDVLEGISFRIRIPQYRYHDSKGYYYLRLDTININAKSLQSQYIPEGDDEGHVMIPLSYLTLNGYYRNTVNAKFKN